MAFLTPCPNCGTRLKSATHFPAGQRLTCPKCREKFISLAESEPFVPTKSPRGRSISPTRSCSTNRTTTARRVAPQGR